ncbi:hypothetical protein [Mesobacillus subterraneus]|uniref:Group-specific protein n=1 Tax=Mesobacillus subterraneus TaxID=285983 RepID=A0A3R9E8U5_9BACI|nr:hypothetical protein [Mesobacillus subterraneus]RSD26576.1 hypothetical protein EJA10_14380 [Mesobacillus subterraneus]
MFDPTAFENIKVVIEGDIYDRDLSGEILVIDRDDWINTAKLSRKYEISFTVKGFVPEKLSAGLVLEAGLENLSAELLGTESANQLAGCKVEIFFSLYHSNDLEVFQDIQDTLQGVWGQDRAIIQNVRHSPLQNSRHIHNKAVISFDRLVYEEQIEDLTNMVDYMNESLKKLKKIIA